MQHSRMRTLHSFWLTLFRPGPVSLTAPLRPTNSHQVVASALYVADGYFEQLAREEGAPRYGEGAMRHLGGKRPQAEQEDAARNHEVEKPGSDTLGVGARAREYFSRKRLHRSKMRLLLTADSETQLGLHSIRVGRRELGGHVVDHVVEAPSEVHSSHLSLEAGSAATRLPATNKDADHQCLAKRRRSRSRSGSPAVGPIFKKRCEDFFVDGICQWVMSCYMPCERTE